jgi:3-methyladenine DNA glycosylase Tag
MPDELDDFAAILASLNDTGEEPAAGPKTRAEARIERETFSKELKRKAATFVTTTETSITTFLDATGIKSGH